MIAYLLIPGLSSILSPSGLVIRKQSIFRDSTFYGLGLITLMSALHSGLSMYHAPILIAIYICYVLVLVFSGQLNVWWSHAIGRPHLAPQHKKASVFRDRYSQISPGSPGVQTSTVPLLDFDDSPLELLCGPESAEIDEVVNWSILYTLTWPLRYIIDNTCPDCRINQPREGWYMITFVTSFAWITFFSFVITVIVGRWVELMKIPSAIFGLVIVAIGAEIPDAVNAITISKRGFGSMAISACLGAQVINVCIGLGLPWLISTTISVGNSFLNISSLLVFIDVVLFVTVVVWSSKGDGLTEITSQKAALLIFWYFCSVGYMAWLA
jgi:Ca2+/Na+ antiporter